jgi:3-mercaptopyruvate sulfurtransferase SseA
VFPYAQVAHIPDALFFDIDGIVDRTTDVRTISENMQKNAYEFTSLMNLSSVDCVLIQYVLDSHIEPSLFHFCLLFLKGVYVITCKCTSCFCFQLPHMLPSKEAFAAAVSALGIRNQDRVIIYDGKGFFSAPRVWW